MTSFNGFKTVLQNGTMERQLNRLAPALLAIAGDRDTKSLGDLMPVNPNVTTRLCLHCTAPFQVTPSQISKGRHFFCSRQCWLDSTRTPESIAKRFWSHVIKAGPDECWRWNGHTTRTGYGMFSVGGRLQLAHRVSYEISIGPIPDGLTIDHVWARGCKFRDCMNSAHLEAVSHRENVARGNALPSVNARKTHCKRGHPLSGDNLLIVRAKTDKPGRWCRICNKEAMRRHYERKRLAQEGKAA